VAYATFNADEESGNTTANATSTVITLPASRDVGDRVRVLLCIDGNPTVTWPSGWTLVFSVNNGTVARLEYYYRDWTGTETAPQGSGGTITVTHATNMASWLAGYLDAGTFDAATAPSAGAPAAVTGSSVSPNPPSHSAAWGTMDNVFEAPMGWDTGTTTLTDADPAGYTAIDDDRGADAQSTGVASAFLNKNSSASDDPGAYTISATRAWVAGTVVHKPAGAAAGAGPTFDHYFRNMRSG
jgi:hypothetical protein